MTTSANPVLAGTPAYPQPRAAGCPFDPAPALHALQADRPITRVRLWDGSTPWLVTRHADQCAVLADPRASADTTRPGFPSASEGTAVRRRLNRTFLSMDDPDHARFRRMVTAPFAIKRVAAMRPKVRQIVDGLIDDLLAGPKPADLVQALALPVPSTVICDLLGMSHEDHDFFQTNSRILTNRESTPAQTVRAQQELLDYMADLVARKLADPADDLLSELAVRQMSNGELTRREAAGLGQLLLVAGHDTTANMIALGTLALLEHPDQWAALRATDDPAGAVNELLRYLTIQHVGRRRVATAPMEIAGQAVRAGEGLILAGELGNRDPAVFADPDRLDIHRDASRHLAFGFGIHQCLGQPLARMELEVVYGTLVRRVPGLRLATDLDRIPFRTDGLVYGVHELPVTW